MRSVGYVWVPAATDEVANAPFAVHVFVTVGIPATDWINPSPLAGGAAQLGLEPSYAT